MCPRGRSDPPHRARTVNLPYIFPLQPTVTQTVSVTSLSLSLSLSLFFYPYLSSLISFSSPNKSLSSECIDLIPHFVIEFRRRSKTTNKTNTHTHTHQFFLTPIRDHNKQTKWVFVELARECGEERTFLICDARLVPFLPLPIGSAGPNWNNETRIK